MDARRLVITLYQTSTIMEGSMAIVQVAQAIHAPTTSSIHYDIGLLSLFPLGGGIFSSPLKFLFKGVVCMIFLCPR